MAFPIYPDNETPAANAFEDNWEHGNYQAGKALANEVDKLRQSVLALSIEIVSLVKVVQSLQERLAEVENPLHNR